MNREIKEKGSAYAQAVFIATEKIANLQFIASDEIEEHHTESPSQWYACQNPYYLEDEARFGTHESCYCKIDTLVDNKVNKCYDGSIDPFVLQTGNRSVFVSAD